MPLTIPNLLTASRIGFAPVMMVLAWLGHERAFLICLIISLATDIFDGKIARWLGQTSEFGSKLDSWADLATYTTLPIDTYWLRPDLVVSEWPAFVVVVCAYVVPITIGFIKYRKLTSYHTRGAVVSAYCIGISVIVMFAHGPTWPLRVAVGVVALAEIEEIAITLVLPVWRANVKDLRAAMAIRRSLLAGNDPGGG